MRGDVALLQGNPAWLALVDLRTGRVIRERRLDGVDLGTILALRDGQWLAVGLRGQMAVAFALDRDTLAPTEIVAGDLRPPPGEFISVSAGAVELDDGVAISGPGLPLAIYDPATWKVRRVIDPVAHWAHVLGGGSLLYAGRSGDMRRFDLATGRQADVPWMPGAGATYTISHARGGGLAIEVPTRPAIVVDSVDVPTIDVAGDRFAVRDGTQVRVHSLADGKRIAAYELGEAGRAHWYTFAFAGNRLVVWVGATLRVIDLRTGAISPAGAPPYDAGQQLAISDDGVVTHHSAHVVRVVAGAVASSTPVDPYLGPARDAQLPARLRGLYGVTGGVRVNPGDVGNYATVSERRDDHLVQRYAVGGTAALHTWRLKDQCSAGWLGSDGTVVVTTHHPDVQLWRLDAAAIDAAPLGPRIHGAAGIDDIDVDAQLAAVTREGSTYVLDLASATAAPPRAVLPRPLCDGFGDAGLERGGDRVYVRERHLLAVFRRSTGALVGAIRLDAGSVAFVPRHDELLIGGKLDELVLWDPVRNEQRAVPAPGLAAVQVSPGGKLAALAFGDGRLAVIDLDALRAAVAAQPAAAFEMPSRCDSHDPHEIEPEEP